MHDCVCWGREREKEKVKGNEVEGVQTDIRRGGGGQCEEGEVEMVGEREFPPPTYPAQFLCFECCGFANGQVATGGY